MNQSHGQEPEKTYGQLRRQALAELRTVYDIKTLSAQSVIEMALENTATTILLTGHRIPTCSTEPLHEEEHLANSRRKNKPAQPLAQS